MPYVDGLSVCRYLRLRSRSVRILIVSGMQPISAEANAILASPATGVYVWCGKWDDGFDVRTR